MLSAVTPAAFQHIAALAPTLKEAELRVLLHLTAAALASSSTSVRASSRDIADACKCSRRNVQHAVDALTQRGLIATRQGTSTSAAAYLLRFLEVLPMGGVTAAPPPFVGGVGVAPGVASKQRQGGAITAPPPSDSEGLPAEPSALDIKTDSIVKIDRALTANPKTFQRGELNEVARKITHSAAKMGRAYERDPDATVCAQIYEACGRSLQQLEWLVIEIYRTRQQPGESPVWWVTVALQRCQGVAPKDIAARRAELKAARRPRLVSAPAAPAIASADPAPAIVSSPRGSTRESGQPFDGIDVQALAARKAM
jgi:hypothetical protein